MRLSAFLLLAALSLLPASARPRYGGTLRIEMRAAPQSIEAAERLAPLVFEPLVPALAIPEKQSRGVWRFRLRRGVKFHDGSPLTAAAVAAALPDMQVRVEGDAIAVWLNDLSELAGTPIVLRAQDGTVAGTGPFRVVSWEAGRRAVLTANEEYRDGRPFLDSISVEMGRAPGDQLLDLELGKADFVEVWPNDLRRAQRAGVQLWSSAPVSLLALVCERVDDPRLREALALSIDRAAIHSVLLQKQGDPAGGLLPQWVGGYAFLFPAARDVARARELVQAPPPLTLAYDASDPLARNIAERISLNAREAGIKVQTVAGQEASVRMTRMRLPSTEPGPALRGLAAMLGAPAPEAAKDLEALYTAESGLLEGFRVIPLFHLPETYAAAPSVRVWNGPAVLESGEWRLADIWVEAERQ